MASSSFLICVSGFKQHHVLILLPSGTHSLVRSRRSTEAFSVLCNMIATLNKLYVEVHPDLLTVIKSPTTGTQGPTFYFVGKLLPA